MEHLGDKYSRSKVTAGVVIVAALAVTVPATPSSAQGLQGFFESLFGGIARRAPPPPPIQVNVPSRVVAPLPQRERRQQESVRSSSGVHPGYCVRLCDGRYFPVQGHRNASAVTECNSFCPASPTKVFSGGAIEHAKAADGQRYADLPNAFAYRERIVSGCTCNGKDSVGLAQVPVKNDPTLQPGDIVASSSGFTVYNGRDAKREAAFTPLDEARVSKSVRSQLADVKITPRLSTDDAPVTPVSLQHTSAARPQRVSAR